MNVPNDPRKNDLRALTGAIPHSEYQFFVIMSYYLGAKLMKYVFISPGRLKYTKYNVRFAINDNLPLLRANNIRHYNGSQ